MFKVPIGTIMQTFHGVDVPKNWVILRGQFLKRDDYPELFKVIENKIDELLFFSLKDDKLKLPRLSDKQALVIMKVKEDIYNA